MHRINATCSPSFVGWYGSLSQPKGVRMEDGVNKMLSVATVVDIDGRAWMLVPVYDWLARMMDEYARAAKNGTDLFDEKKLAS